jgi:HicB family
MDITPYVETLRQDLAAAAEAGGPEIRAAAERLGLALDPAVRLVLMDALSQAAAEITSELPEGVVEVRLKGREPQLHVDVPRHSGPPAPPDPPSPPVPGAHTEEDEEEGTIARITLRIPEAVKFRAEELAAKSGHSLNGWIVNVLRNATRDRGAINVDIDLSSIPFFDDGRGTRSGRPGSRRMSGWV